MIMSYDHLSYDHQPGEWGLEVDSVSLVQLSSMQSTEAIISVQT